MVCLFIRETPARGLALLPCIHCNLHFSNSLKERCITNHENYPLKLFFGVGSSWLADWVCPLYPCSCSHMQLSQNSTHSWWPVAEALAFLFFSSLYSLRFDFWCLSLFHFFLAFQVSSLVQVVGIILCLHAATKISHRAQGIASLASKWHALSTCSSTDTSQLRTSTSTGNLEAYNRPNSLHINYSESDLESLDYVVMPTSAQLASYMSSYHKRQAFGTKIKLSCYLLYYILLHFFLVFTPVEYIYIYIYA